MTETKENTTETSFTWSWRKSNTHVIAFLAFSILTLISREWGQGLFRGVGGELMKIRPPKKGLNREGREEGEGLTELLQYVIMS